MMTRSQIKKQLERGLNTVFGLEYKRYPEEWRLFYDVFNMDKAFVEDVLMVGLGAGQEKAEGEGVAYDEGAESWTKRYIARTVALAFAISEEAVEDNLYMDMGSKYTRALARGMQHAKEIYGADPINNGFTGGAYAIGDGQPLYSTSHPLYYGGVGANTLATQADLAEASLEDMLTLIDNCKDDRGIPARLSAVKLIVPPALKYTAYRLLESVGRPGTADNDPNALRGMALISGGHGVNRYLTDTNSWHIKTDCPDGFKHFIRKKISGGMQGDFETGNLRFKKRERYDFGVTNWRAGFACAGAS